MRLSRIVIMLLVLVGVLVLAVGCTTGETTTSTSVTTGTNPDETSAVTFPSGTDLEFEDLLGSGLGGSYEGDDAQVAIITSPQNTPSEAIEWIHTADNTTISEVDYSEYFVVLLFNGWRGGIFDYLNIQRVWQDDSNVYLLAHFNDFIPKATSLPSTNSQYRAVKIHRSQIMQPGLTTFILFDETGDERARTTAEIIK